MAGEVSRRELPRLGAPVVCRPRGLTLFQERPPRGVDLGGVRIYSDDELKVGTRLEIEVFLPGGDSVTAGVEVVWLEALGDGAPARYDLGLRFLELRLEDRARLKAVLHAG